MTTKSINNVRWTAKWRSPDNTTHEIAINAHVYPDDVVLASAFEWHEIDVPSPSFSWRGRVQRCTSIWTKVVTWNLLDEAGDVAAIENTRKACLERAGNLAAFLLRRDRERRLIAANRAHLNLCRCGNTLTISGCKQCSTLAYA